jgi:Zn-dependent protease
VNPLEPQNPNDQREVVEGEYLPPDPNPASGRNWRAAGPGAVIGLGIVAAKFKGLLFTLLSFKWLLFGAKFGLTALSFLASIWFYALLWGWKFAIVFVLLIAIHEVGHLIFVRSYGLKAPGIYFLPGFGAFTTWSGNLESAYQEAVIAFGGPLLGTLGSLGCLSFGLITGEPFWYAAANVGVFLNLLNMIPLGFFDGGRIAGAISPKLWIAGFVVIIAAAIGFHWFSPILLIVVLLSVPRMIAVFRGGLDPRYYAIPPEQRAKITFAYFGLMAVLLATLVFTHVPVPGHPLEG